VKDAKQKEFNAWFHLLKNSRESKPIYRQKANPDCGEPGDREKEECQKETFEGMGMNIFCDFTGRYVWQIYQIIL
jgi:hypothetical protein